MCSIAGIVGIAFSEDQLRSSISAMNTVQRHRGPDGNGIWLGNGVAFGHRRLSIIDLSSAGQQPLLNEDNSLVLVCNGEIYNYRSLRQTLEQRGHIFRSSTDIEVILHLYEEYGDALVEHLVGMFAFALWDKSAKRLLVARDRIGEKPLYYIKHANGLCFASEIKALLELPFATTQLDQEAVCNLLVYPSSPAPLTFFKGIYALPPASLLTWELDQIAINRYWKIDFKAISRAWSKQDAADQYAHLIRTSVNEASSSDVPLGVLLSGGVDSSTIALEAADVTSHLSTFCVVSGQENDPEMLRAAFVAAQINSKHHQIRFSPYDISLLPEILCHYDQPFNVFAMLYAYQLSREVSKHVKVVLGGNGADELFGGYSGYNKHRFFSFCQPFLKYIPRHLLNAAGRANTTINKLSNIMGSDPATIRGQQLNLAGRNAAATLFTTAYRHAYDSYAPGLRLVSYAQECNPRDYLDTVLYTDLMQYHQHGTTIMGDISGMAHGLEIRSPFLDHRLIEFAYSLPRNLTIPKLWSTENNKLIMKQHLARNLPHNLVYAKKMGFGYDINFAKLINGPWQLVIKHFVQYGNYLDLGIFTKDGVEWALRNSPTSTWMLLIFSIWSELYLLGSKTTNITEQIKTLLPANINVRQ